MPSTMRQQARKRVLRRPMHGLDVSADDAKAPMLKKMFRMLTAKKRKSSCYLCRRIVQILLVDAFVAVIYYDARMLSLISYQTMIPSRDPDESLRPPYGGPAPRCFHRRAASRSTRQGEVPRSSKGATSPAQGKKNAHNLCTRQKEQNCFSLSHQKWPSREEATLLQGWTLETSLALSNGGDGDAVGVGQTQGGLILLL